MVGGAEVAVKEITDRISDFEFDMVTFRFNSSDKANEKIGNINVYRIDSSRLFFSYKAFLFARNLHRQHPYDIVWAIMANRAGLAALFFKKHFPQVKYVLTLQEGDPPKETERKVWFMYQLWKKIFLRADIIQVISNFLADWARSIGYKGKIEVIPNGVDIKKFEIGQHSVLTSDKVVLVTTSRLVEKNGVGDIIESLKYLPENIELYVAGIGPLESALKLKAKSLQLEARIKFLGLVSQHEIPKYLHDSDVFIRPSLSEGMGNSFIEAMAAGLPVIATPVGGIPDFLKDGETGLFCKVHDPASIAEQVKRLMDDSPLRQQIINNARKMVSEKYDWDLISKEMREKVFENHKS